MKPAQLYVIELQDLLTEYDQHIRNEALKIMRDLYFTAIKNKRALNLTVQEEIGLPLFERKATDILKEQPLFDFEAANNELFGLAQLYRVNIRPANPRPQFNQGRDIIRFNYHNDLYAIKQKQDGIKILQDTLKDNGNSASTKLDNFMRAYQSDTFHGHAQRVLKKPTLFAQRRHQDGTLHNFWKAVDAILTKLGFGVSTQGVTGAKVDKKIWGMFEKAGVKKAEMEEAQARQQAQPLQL